MIGCVEGVKLTARAKTCADDGLPHDSKDAAEDEGRRDHTRGAAKLATCQDTLLAHVFPEISSEIFSELLLNKRAGLSSRPRDTSELVDTSLFERDLRAGRCHTLGTDRTAGDCRAGQHIEQHHDLLLVAAHAAQLAGDVLHGS